MSEQPDHPGSGLLFAAPNWLGDLVMSSALVSALRRVEFAGSDPGRLTVSAPRQWLPLLQDDPRIDTLIDYDRGGAHAGLRGIPALAARWRAAGCGTAILGPPSFLMAATAVLAGLPRRIGFRGDGRSWLLRPGVGRPPRGDRHYIDELALLLAAWSGETDRPAMPWPDLPGCVGMPAAEFGDPDPWALAIGATYGEAKSWPVERVLEFISLAIRERGVRIILLGDGKARGVADRIIAASDASLVEPSDDRPGLIDRVGRTDLSTVVSILKSVRLFLGGDSGLMHLAAALGVPTAGLFGSTNPAWTAPRGPRVKVVRSPSFSCQPCYRRVCNQTEFCLAALDAQTVLGECDNLLDGGAGDSTGVYRGIADGPQARPTIFLDRDGVLLRDTGYLHDPDSTELLVGSAEALRDARSAGWRLVCLTNQSGIGRGYYPESAFRAVQKRLDERLEAAGAKLDGVYFCPHAPEADCDCRKPRTGMIAAAARDAAWRSGAWMIGDKRSDIRMAQRAGLRPVLVLSGEGRTQRSSIDPQVPVAVDLADAIDGILQDRWL